MIIPIYWRLSNTFQNYFQSIKGKFRQFSPVGTFFVGVQTFEGGHIYSATWPNFLGLLKCRRFVDGVGLVVSAARPVPDIEIFFHGSNLLDSRFAVDYFCEIFSINLTHRLLLEICKFHFFVNAAAICA